MATGSGLLTNDVLLWKAIGAAVWASAIAAAASSTCSLALAPGTLLSPIRLLGATFSLSSWLSSAGGVLAAAPAVIGATLALRAREPRPAAIHRLLHWPRLAPAAVLVSKLAARLASLGAAACTAAFLVLHCLSALLFLAVSPAATARGTPASWTLLYSACLAVTYLLHWVYWSQDVLAFPSVQRHRYFRLKQRLPAAAARAATLAPAALAAAAATAALRAHALGSPMAAALPLSAGGAVAALLAGFLCTFCWLAASATVEVVFSERLRPDDYSQRDELGAMAASLSGKKGGFMQALALHDASLLPDDVGRAALRRADLFADDSGERWKPVAEACLAELDALSAAVAVALQQPKPAGGAGAAAPSGGTRSQHKWNVLPPSLSTKASLGSNRPQLEALLAVRHGYAPAALAARALAGLACASRAEDRFGVLQLTQPGLGEVLLSLLGVLGATQQLMRATASLPPRSLRLGPWRGSGDAAAWSAVYSCPAVDAAVCALQDTLTVALYRTTAAFGDGLLKVLADCKSKPACGSSAEAAALLKTFLAGQA